MGWSYRQLGDDQAAQTVLDGVEREHSDSVYAMMSVGIDYAQRGGNEEAVKRFLRARELAPSEAEASVWLSLMATEREDHEAALQWAQDALARNPEHLAARRQVAYSYMALQRYQEARNAYQDVLELDPSSEDWAQAGLKAVEEAMGGSS